MSEVEKFSQKIEISTKAMEDIRKTLEDIHKMPQAIQRWAIATPEERAEKWREIGRQRAAERASTEPVPLTLEALLDKLGFDEAYATHLVQPYCYCSDSRDGWDYCEHARDEDVG